MAALTRAGIVQVQQMPHLHFNDEREANKKNPNVPDVEKYEAENGICEHHPRNELWLG